MDITQAGRKKEGRGGGRREVALNYQLVCCQFFSINRNPTQEAIMKPQLACA